MVLSNLFRHVMSWKHEGRSITSPVELEHYVDNFGKLWSNEAGRTNPQIQTSPVGGILVSLKIYLARMMSVDSRVMYAHCVKVAPIIVMRMEVGES